MESVEQAVASLGGSAATHELLDRHHTPSAIWRAVQDGRVVRVRKGWYASTTLDQDILSALRVGGRLACVSAAKHYRLWLPTDPGLHVAVPHSASRLRRPTDHKARIRDHPGEAVIHWSDRPTGGRLVVPPADCLREVGDCLPAEDAFVILESALRQRLVSAPAWSSLRRDLPAATRRLAQHASALSDSGSESIVKLALLRLGIPFRQQVSIPGVGRVDFLIGARLVIEVDSLAFHPDAHRDRSRDGELGLRGYRVLRFMYWHVRRDLGWVERVILAACNRGDHLHG